jgi:hypothetical protein
VDCAAHATPVPHHATNAGLTKRTAKRALCANALVLASALSSWPCRAKPHNNASLKTGGPFPPQLARCTEKSDCEACFKKGKSGLRPESCHSLQSSYKGKRAAWGCMRLHELLHSAESDNNILLLPVLPALQAASTTLLNVAVMSCVGTAQPACSMYSTSKHSR